MPALALGSVPSWEGWGRGSGEKETRQGRAGSGWASPGGGAPWRPIAGTMDTEAPFSYLKDCTLEVRLPI